MPDARVIRRVAVIMAGGSGERFWPLSRLSRPKQLLRLTGETQTMLEASVSRLAPLISREDIHVATGEPLVEAIQKAGVGVPDENVIAEPCKRNTSGCLVFATAHLLAKHGGRDPGMDVRRLPQGLSMAVVTADHSIDNPEAFREAVRTALDAAEEEHALATIGIVPTRPETGYGYIQVPEDRLPLPNYTQGVQVFPVTAFHEKPDRARAEAFIATGRYFWNSGMFFWNVADFLGELEVVRPELARATLAMAEAMRAGDPGAVRASFEGIENIPIDRALMERARKVLMVRAPFAWDDIGSWPALDRVCPRDANGNVIRGDPIVVGSTNCIIYRDLHPGARDIAVAVVGAEDLVVVVTDDAVLVMPKDRAQDVKHVLTELRRRNAKQV